MEQTVCKFGKEMVSYADERHDYVGDHEITITITLSEYRDLVKKNAVADEKYVKLMQTVDAKNAEIAKLNAKIEAMTQAAF